MFFKWYQGERREQHRGALHLHKCHLLRSSSWCRGQDWQVFILNVAILILIHFCFFLFSFQNNFSFHFAFQALWHPSRPSLFQFRPVFEEKCSPGGIVHGRHHHQRRRLHLHDNHHHECHHLHWSPYDHCHHQNCINTIAIIVKSRSPKVMMTTTITGRSGEHWPLWVRNSNLGAHSLPSGCLDHRLPLPRQGPRLQTPDISDFSDVQGIQSSGKVVYFSATFPYVVLMILLIRFIIIFLQKVSFSPSILKVKKSVGFEKQTKPNDKLYVFSFIRAVTLPGASLGINFYLVRLLPFQEFRTLLSRLLYLVFGDVYLLFWCVCVFCMWVCVFGIWGWLYFLNVCALVLSA